MNIPNPPSDNLYKFMAISGLVIVGYCLLVPYQKSMDLRLQDIELSKNAVILELKSKFLQSSLEDLGAEVKKLGVLLEKEKRENRKNLASLSSESGKLEDSWEKLYQAHFDQKVKTVEIEYSSKKNQSIGREPKTNLNYILLWIGDRVTALWVWFLPMVHQVTTRSSH